MLQECYKYNVQKYDTVYNQVCSIDAVCPINDTLL